MNCGIREAFLNLRLDMVFAHQKWHYKSIKPGIRDRDQSTLLSEQYRYFGGVVDAVRLGIETHGYHRSHQHELAVILSFLKEVGDSELSEKLQSIIDSLSEPEHC